MPDAPVLKQVLIETSGSVYRWSYGDDPAQLVHFVEYLQRCIEARQLTTALAAQTPLPIEEKDV